LHAFVGISVLTALGSAFVACGSGGGGGEDPQKVVDQTFSPHPELRRGRLDLSIGVVIRQQGQEGGRIRADLHGPFESQGSGELPRFEFGVSGGYDNLDPAVPESDFEFSGGLTSTGDAAYLTIKKGQLFAGDFRLDPPLFALLREVVLGIGDAKSWLTNLENEGDSEVAGTSTTHISGGIDLDELANQLDGLFSNARVLGALNGSAAAPQLLGSLLPPPGTFDRVKGLVKTARFDLYSGTGDRVLRRLTVDLALSGVSVRSVRLTIDNRLSDVNEPQRITAPADSKPFSDLVKQYIRALSVLGD
jgi:hypothetical protein